MPLGVVSLTCRTGNCALEALSTACSGRLFALTEILPLSMTSYYRDPGAPAPNVPPRVGVAAVIERNGEILVERRADTDVDEWAFIGGGLGEDEPLLTALHREVREETGFEIADTTLLGVFSDPTRIIAYPDGNICRVVSIVFKVIPEGTAEPILSDESREMRFVPRTELAALDFWPAQRPIRDAVVAGSAGIVIA